MSLTCVPGYARNYLLPQEKSADRLGGQHRGFRISESAQLEARNLETKQEAADLAGRLDGQQFIVIRQASDGGSLYGSVTPRDAAEAATEAGFSIDRKQIIITSPIKELGLHTVMVSLHPEVDAEIKLNVARSQEEAELQASGKSIQELAAEEEAAADFEIQELFDDIGAAASDDDELAETAGISASDESGDSEEQPQV